MMSEMKQVEYATDIIEKVATYYEVPLKNIYSKDRHREIVKVCQISTWLILKKMPKMRLIKISEMYGVRYFSKNGYDHSVVIYNRKSIQGMIDVKDTIFNDVVHLLKII